MNFILFLVFLFPFASSHFTTTLSQEKNMSYTIKKERISTQKAQKLVEKYQDPKTDMLSLLFDKPNPTCLQVMKELRLIDKKNKDPLSDWKLLKVISEKEIYFATYYQRPSKKYVLHQLIKRHEQFYHTTLSCHGEHPSPQKTSDLLKIIQNKKTT
jgi:hypothetical protein